ncbi:MAG: hypothetical protein HOW73_00585 [Polyangiaceae bacterium]|nr:hypothetical protein [Polyangiaceae bacterium]
MTAIAAISVFAAACGSSQTEPASSNEEGVEPTSSEGAATTAKATAASTAQADAGPAVVTTCEKQGDLCLPTAAFVKKLCGNVNPDLALVYFKKDSPFSRGYLTRNTDAWNASGGASSSNDKLAFDEEVIVLSVKKNTTGIEVSGAGGGYDVLRWDGSCASLSGEELTFKAPPKAKNAKLRWQDYSEESQSAFVNDATLGKINKERRDECKGVTMGDVSKACEKAVDKLSDAIAAYVRGGGDVPVPKALK